MTLNPSQELPVRTRTLGSATVSAIGLGEMPLSVTAALIPRPPAPSSTPPSTRG